MVKTHKAGPATQTETGGPEAGSAGGASTEAATAAAQENRPEALQQYLNRYCREPATHGDYLERIGIKRLLALYEY